LGDIFAKGFDVRASKGVYYNFVSVIMIEKPKVKEKKFFYEIYGIDCFNYENF